MCLPSDYHAADSDRYICRSIYAYDPGTDDSDDSHSAFPHSS
jgi:hypothetical protein